jgi:hypothetical protein
MGWRVDRRNDQAVLSIGSTGKGKMTFSRPNGVVVIAWLYLTVGIGAFAANFPRLLAAEPDSFMMEVTEAVAIVARCLPAPPQELGPLARDCLDGVSRSDQLS